MELNEGIIDNIYDFLRSHGVMKTKWRSIEIGDGGVGDLSDVKQIMWRFDDEQMLRIVKVLKKKDGDGIFNYAGFTDSSKASGGFTFLDLAIANGNILTLDYILDNVNGLYVVAGVNLFTPARVDKLSRNGWIKGNGLKFINYLIKNASVSPADGFTNNNIKAVTDFLAVICRRGTSWNMLNSHIEGITNTDNLEINNILINNRSLNRFVKNDDVEFATWVLKYSDYHWMDDALLKDSPPNGKVIDLLNNDPEITKYGYNNLKKLKISVENWLPDEAKDIFLF